jgi:hypothetical protein
MTNPIRWRVYAGGHLAAAFPGHVAKDAEGAAAYTWRTLPGFADQALVVERIEGTKVVSTKHRPAKKAAA